MIGPRTSVAAAIMSAAIAQAATPAIAAWERFHGDAANRGFANVDTKPAGAGSVSVPGLGAFAQGAGPVIAPDGTVYLGTKDGKLIALKSDGKPFWSRDITKGESIVASPAVGADGSIYVIGTKSTTIRDHRGGRTITKRVVESTLHKFTSGGGWVAQTPFPVRSGNGGASSAPPNIVTVSGREIILAPAVYVVPNGIGTDVRLIGFSPGGGVVLDQLVKRERAVITGGANPFCFMPISGWIGCLLDPNIGMYDPPRGRSAPPMPGVAIFTFAGGGAPFAIVSDQRHDIVGFTVSSGPVLKETFRVHDAGRRLLSAPMTLPDGHTLVGAGDGSIIFGGPNANKLAPVNGPRVVYGAPTRTVNGSVAAVGASGLALLRDGKVVSQASLPPSFTSAAASRTHVFVSTTDALITFDANAQNQVQRFDWVGGGTSPPALGPDGRVYAIASDILFVFPPPLRVKRPLPRAPGAILQKDPGGQ